MPEASITVLLLLSCILFLYDIFELSMSMSCDTGVPGHLSRVLDLYEMQFYVRSQYIGVGLRPI